MRPEQPHHYEAVIYVDISTAATQVDIRTLTPTYVHIVATKCNHCKHCIDQILSHWIFLFQSTTCFCHCTSTNDSDFAGSKFLLSDFRGRSWLWRLLADVLIILEGISEEAFGDHDITPILITRKKGQIFSKWDVLTFNWFIFCNLLHFPFLWH